MEGKMKVLRLNAPKDLEYTEAPIPHPGLNEVLCRVESTSICGTDPHIINGDFPGFWPKSFPLIPGHEWAGQVVELGQNAELYGWKVGDRVAGIANMGCGFCKNCLEGRWTICLNYGKPKIHKMYGHITPGAYAQYINISIKSIGKIPDDMDYNLAACMDPLSIALHMVERSGLQCGEDVLVNGSGAQGIMAVLICKHLGAGRVFISGSGHTLYEQLEWNDKGEIMNANLADFKIPTMKDAGFPLHIKFVEVPHPEGPYGAKGIGECPVISVASAIGNAVNDATGVRIHTIPIKPDHMYLALKQHNFGRENS